LGIPWKFRGFFGNLADLWDFLLEVEENRREAEVLYASTHSPPAPNRGMLKIKEPTENDLPARLCPKWRRKEGMDSSRREERGSSKPI
jgi:hypothetical protein